MYFLTESQRSACEAVWRALARHEFPLGLSRDMLFADDARAKYQVAQTIRMLSSDMLIVIVERETDAFGPLSSRHRFEWTERTMRAVSDHRPLLAALQPPVWRCYGT